MIFQRTLLSLAITGLIGAIISLATRPACGQDSSSESGQSMTSFKSAYGVLNDHGSLAQQGDQNSVRALADAVFSFPAAHPPIPAAIERVMKDRLVRAEISYRQGKTSSVREEDVVSLINSIARKIGAPDYVLTSASQIRHSRMLLAVAEPQFMGEGMARPGTNLNEAIDPTMSPLQAAHLIGFLATQKAIAAEFQVTPEEWDRTAHRMPPPLSGGSAQARLVHNPKRREMYDKFWALASTLELKDGLDMAEEFFRTLRIDQPGEGLQ